MLFKACVGKKHDRSTGVTFEEAIHDDTDNRKTSQLIKYNFAKLNPFKQDIPTSTMESETIINMVRYVFQKLVKKLSSSHTTSQHI